MGNGDAIGTVVAAARALALAGQWDLAAELLASSGGDDPRTLLARADQEVWRDFWLGTRGAGEALAAASAAATRAGDPWYAWEVDLLTLRHDYFSAIIGPDGSPRIGPGAHDPATRAELTTRAARLHESAPSDARGGWAAFWRGVIADNVAGDAEAARPRYEEARAAGETHGDDALAAEALRHLGADARRQGDHDRARDLWELSTWRNQRAGLVPWALSQQLALAHHAVDRGDPDRAAAIAAEVHRWADALQLTRLAGQARGLLAEE